MRNFILNWFVYFLLCKLKWPWINFHMDLTFKKSLKIWNKVGIYIFISLVMSCYLWVVLKKKIVMFFLFCHVIESFLIICLYFFTSCILTITCATTLKWEKYFSLSQIFVVSLCFWSSCNFSSTHEFFQIMFKATTDKMCVYNRYEKITKPSDF